MLKKLANQYKIIQLDHQPNIKKDGYPIDRVKTHRYLGIEIDDTLTWQSLIIKKLTDNLAALK